MSNDPHISSRRRFLQRSLSLIPLAAAGGTLLTQGAQATVVKSEAVTEQYVASFFNDDEWRTVIALTDRLIPEDEMGPGAVSEGVPIYIDKQLELPYGYGHLWYMQGPFAEAVPELGYQSPLVPRETWRRGIRALNQWCQGQYNTVFASLSPAIADSILQQLEEGSLNFSDISGKLFFTQVLENTKEGYLADPIHGGNQTLASWKLIGYPGARADYPQVLDHPNQTYPLGPVSISGKRTL
ncbi:gluconate 2-dehydrogenase subunit 3 family protein [Rosenbergiella collisarenosi]|uniref:gluconate 2-dehydrogenase subunit 3 family protein n=1 Tax=Rosenbergiella collisarenosi TaxID=1544695 RepID=UPI001BD9C8EC|nr:gluconate 2-dehydrogenase subunit 3 family protein [Rosenbergiella collisarenosi]MBT0720182.1 gluconate 2-dehydrogenase subunit 3 family protein [Rosenbergiella collisarenosi]